MSTKYKHSHDVPTAVLAKRLDELSDAVGQRGEDRDRELTRRIPAELDRDADLVLLEASTRLLQLEAKLARADDRAKRQRQLEAQLQGEINDMEGIKAERDALAAHVALIRSWGECKGLKPGERWEQMMKIIDGPPTTSLAHRDAQMKYQALWQAIDAAERAGWETAPLGLMHTFKHLREHYLRKSRQADTAGEE